MHAKLMEKYLIPKCKRLNHFDNLYKFKLDSVPKFNKNSIKVILKNKLKTFLNKV